MTDKEKIRAYIEKLHLEHRGSEGDFIFRKALRTVLFYIDSMQEEPSETKSKCMYALNDFNDEDRKVLCDGCEEDCKYNKKERKKEPSIPDIVDEHFYEMLGEEPVSEDLGEYINELSKQFPEVSFAKLSRIAVRVAKWQKQKDMVIFNELAELANHQDGCYALEAIQMRLNGIINED